MKKGHLIAAAAALCPFAALLGGCGAASVISAASNVANTGAGFDSKVVDPTSPVAVPTAPSQTAPTAAIAPVSVITPTQSANIVSQLGSGHIKDLNPVLTLSVSEPNTQVGIVITQTPLDNPTFWQIAGVTSSRTAGVTAGTITNLASLGALVTFKQGGTYTFGPSGITGPSGVPNDIYAGDLITAAATNNVVLNNTDLNALLPQFEDMLRSGNTISVYLRSYDPTGASQVTVQGLDITGHTSVTL